MQLATTLKELSIPEAFDLVTGGAALVDLRPVNDYLDVHVPGSLSLQYEFGPGMAARARDCVPLDVPLVLMAAERIDMRHAAASLRGKGFSVLGAVASDPNKWARGLGGPASTEQVTAAPPSGVAVLNVHDSGAPSYDDAIDVPVERLWAGADEYKDSEQVVVLAGQKVRAALAVGILERAGVKRVVMWAGR